MRYRRNGVISMSTARAAGFVNRRLVLDMEERRIESQQRADERAGNDVRQRLNPRGGYAILTEMIEAGFRGLLGQGLERERRRLEEACR